MTTTHYVPTPGPNPRVRTALCGIVTVISGGWDHKRPIGSSDIANVTCEKCKALSAQGSLFK